MLYFTGLEAYQWHLTCLGGSGRLNVSYFTCLEAQNVDKFITFAWFGDGRLWEAKSVVFYVSGRLWEAQCVVFYVCRMALGGLMCRIIRVLEGSGRQNQLYLTCLEGSGRLWEAKCVVFYVSGSLKRR